MLEVQGVAINIADLRLFLTVASEGSFGRAAQKAFMAQQGVSLAMQRLERQTGAPLFQRSHGGVTLTKAGYQFLPTAHEIVSLAAESTAILNGGSSVDDQHVTVGVVSPAASGVMTGLLRRFRHAFPSASITLRSLQFSDIALALTLSRVDILFSLGPLEIPGWSTQVLYSEPLSVVIPAGHPAAKAASVSVDDLLQEIFVSGTSLPPGWTSVGRLESVRRHGTARLGDPRSTDPRTPLEVNEVVAAGMAVVAAPASHKWTFPHPHVVCVPLMGAPRSDVVVALPTQPLKLAKALASLSTETAHDHYPNTSGGEP
jgi:DNA-binding transcriptional LysR family regulator